MMLVLRYEKGRPAHSRRGDWPNRVLRLVAFKPVYVFNGKYRCARAGSKDRDSAVEADIGLRYSPQDSFREVIDCLARLAGQIFEAVLQESHPG
jgi:hypothetical protein